MPTPCDFLASIDRHDQRQYAEDMRHAQAVAKARAVLSTLPDDVEIDDEPEVDLNGNLDDVAFVVTVSVELS
jgi:hypothetical protein